MFSFGPVWICFGLKAAGVVCRVPLLSVLPHLFPSSHHPQEGLFHELPHRNGEFLPVIKQGKLQKGSCFCIFFVYVSSLEVACWAPLSCSSLTPGRHISPVPGISCSLLLSPRAPGCPVAVLVKPPGGAPGQDSGEPARRQPRRASPRPAALGGSGKGLMVQQQLAKETFHTISSQIFDPSVFFKVGERLLDPEIDY